MSFDWLMDLLRANPSIVPAILFVVALGEAVVFTSPLVPATVLVLGIGAVHKVAGGHFASIAIAAAVGTIIGDIASYWIARTHRDRIAGWWPLRNHPTVLPRAVAFIQKWGVPGLVASKFLGPLRWFGPAVCGVLMMPFAQFVVVTVFASSLWAILLLAPSYFGAQAAGL